MLNASHVRKAGKVRTSVTEDGRTKKFGNVPTLSPIHADMEALLAKEKKGAVRYGMCPWCTETCWHERTEKSFIGRDIFKCPECGKRTLPCMKSDDGCRDMSAGLPDWDEDLCTGCGGWARGDPTRVRTHQPRADSCFRGLRSLPTGICRRQDVLAQAKERGGHPVHVVLVVPEQGAI